MSGTMNTVQQSTESDPLSPTTLILNYLRAHNVQPTAANVREAVLANAREGNQLGADPVAGLRSDRPATEAEDQAAMRAAGAGRGGGGKPKPSGGAPVPMDKHDETSSAPPAQSGLSNVNPATLAQNILFPSARAGVPDIPPPPEAPPAAEVPAVAPPEQTARGSVPAVAPPEMPPRGSVPEVPPVPNPMETAMQRAVGAPEVNASEARVENVMRPGPRFSGIEVPPVVEGVTPPSAEMVANANTNRGPTSPAEAPGDVQFRRTGSGLKVEPGALQRAGVGAVAGYRAGKIPGAVAGAVHGAAPDLIPYIMKNLHLY